jgi:p-hydroxybenzoate 3-monooxygenase
LEKRVAIIGGGPAGVLLQLLLHARGIASVVLERRQRVHVEGRVRAGVLEPGTVAALEAVGLGCRMRAEGLVHDGFSIASGGDPIRIDLAELAGESVVVYGQTQITRDLIRAALDRGCEIVFGAEDVALHGVDTDCPRVTWNQGGNSASLTCDLVAGCDGFHGVSRRSIPSDVMTSFERTYPFAWLGILAESPPCAEELVYASHERGFALASMRSPTLSRYYIQVPSDEPAEGWAEDDIWAELTTRLGAGAVELTRGRVLETSLARLRGFVAEPMAWRRLFLAGDAAHVVPPTGAKGLNLAVADAVALSAAFTSFFEDGDEAGLEAYSPGAIARAWRAERFSSWLTGVTHRFPAADGFDRRVQRSEIEWLRRSRPARQALARAYVGCAP